MDQRRPPRKGGNNAPAGRGPRPNSGPRSNSGPRPNDGPRPRPRRPRSGHPTPRPAGEGADRLQKLLAHAGVDSRRACEELILKGRVTVNGKVVKELGTKVDPRRATIAVDGEPIQGEKLVYYAVYKPKGYVSTNADPSGRPRVVDLLPEIPQRVYTVGRLDEMSNGLMILTNDGNLAHQLAHPKYGVEKLYRVVVAGTPSHEVLKQLTDGIWLAEGKVRAKRVRAIGKRGDSTILEMVLSEGKNREVRRMLAKLGNKVMSLTRIAVGPVSIKGLASGRWRPLTSFEVTQLRKAAAGEFIAPFAPPRARPVLPERTLPPAPQAQAQAQGGPADRRPAPPRPEGPGPGPRPPAMGMGPRPGGRSSGPPSPPPRPAGPGDRPRVYVPPPRRDETERGGRPGSRPAMGPGGRPGGPSFRPPGPGDRPHGPADRSHAPRRADGPGPRPHESGGRPGSPPRRPERPGDRPSGPADRHPAPRRADGPGPRDRGPGGPPPRPPGPGDRPPFPGSRRPNGPGPGGPGPGPDPSVRTSRPLPPGPGGGRPPGPGGSRPLPPGPGPGRRPEPDRIVDPTGGGFDAPRAGRRMIGMESESGPPPSRPRPRPAGKRPPLRPKPPRRAPGSSSKARRPRPGGGGD